MSEALTLETPPCPASLTPEHLTQYQRDGYLAFTDVLSTEEVQAARAALTELIHRVARDGERHPKHSVCIMADSRLQVQYEAGLMPEETDPDLELKVRKLFWYVDHHEFLQQLATTHPRLRAVREALLGPEPILFQDMALVKPPFIGREKPWHQDDAYFAVEPLQAVAGIWIALDEATVENGCMHVIAGGHNDGPRIHYHGSDCEINPERLDLARVVPVPLPPGGAMFFSGLLPHQTPPNSSPDRRRALQLHYRSRDSRSITREEYNMLFAEGGVPASCAANPPGA